MKKAGGRLLIPSGQMTADSIGLYLMAEERAPVCSGQSQTHCCCKDLWPPLYTFPQTVVYLQLVEYERLQCTTVLLYLLMFTFVYYFKTWHSARSFLLNRYQMILPLLTFYIYEYFSYRW